MGMSIGRASKACKGKRGQARNRCMSQKMRGGKRRRSRRRR